jgi:acetyl-CoA C-acetyltransferase
MKLKNEEKLIAVDEFPRPNTTLDGLTKLRPCFIENGSITAGNASGKTKNYMFRNIVLFLNI